MPRGRAAGHVRYDISADSTDLRREVYLVGQHLRNFERENRRMARSVERNNRTMRGFVNNLHFMRGAIGLLVGAGGLGYLVREFTEAADTMTLLRARLRLVSDGTEELAQNERILFELAQETRQGLEATFTLYTRAARASRELGISQQQLVVFTRAVNQAILVSGATQAEATAGTIQFTQALASNRLGGEELRSTLEQLPRIARALARDLGVNIGQLRELGETGQLSTNVILGAILRQADEIDREFKTVERTVGQAFTQLQNQTIRTTEEIAKASGVTAEFNRTLDDTRQLIASDEFKSGATFFGTLFSFGLRQTREDTKALLLGLEELSDGVRELFDPEALARGFDLALEHNQDLPRLFAELEGRFADIRNRAKELREETEATADAGEVADIPKLREQVPVVADEFDRIRQSLVRSRDTAQALLRIEGLTGEDRLRARAELELGNRLFARRETLIRQIDIAERKAAQSTGTEARSRSQNTLRDRRAELQSINEAIARLPELVSIKLRELEIDEAIAKARENQRLGELGQELSRQFERQSRESLFGSIFPEDEEERGNAAQDAFQAHATFIDGIRRNAERQLLASQSRLAIARGEDIAAERVRVAVAERELEIRYELARLRRELQTEDTARQREALERELHLLNSREVAGEDVLNALRASRVIEEQLVEAGRQRVQFAEAFGDALVSGLSRAVGQASDLASVLRSIGANILSSLLQFGLNSILNPATTSQPFAFLNRRTVEPVASPITAGLIPRQTGGPVGPGRLFKVGENGEEIFAPTIPGEIIANPSSLRGGAPQSVTINYNFNVQSTDGPGVRAAGFAIIEEAKRQTVPLVLGQIQQDAGRPSPLSSALR